MNFCSFRAEVGNDPCILGETKRRTDFLGKEISSTRRCNRLYWRRNASYLRREDIQIICETIFEHFHICEDAEITIEANPGTVDLKKLCTYRENGINRISFGLQSTVKEELEYLGRIHTYEEFLQSFDWARQAGF